MTMKKLLTCKAGVPCQDKAYTLFRVVLGLAFFYHGYVKVFNMGLENVTGFFAAVGIPAAGLMAFLVSYGELLGGLALMLGFLTHWIAKVNILIMLGAIGFVHFGAEGGWFWGYGADGGYEYQLLLLAANILVMVHGYGKYSIDRILIEKCEKPEASY